MQSEWLALIPNCVSTATGPEKLSPLSIEIDKPPLLNSAAEPGGILAAVKALLLGPGSTNNGTSMSSLSAPDSAIF